MPRVVPKFVKSAGKFAFFYGVLATVSLSTWYVINGIIFSPFVELVYDDGRVNWHHLYRFGLETSLPVFIGTTILAGLIGRKYPSLFELHNVKFGENSQSEAQTLLEIAICTGCGKRLLHDGSIAGAELTCHHCQTPIKIPGETCRNQVVESDYSFDIYGHHPIQAEGRVLGHPFYFRAKYDFWDFTVVTSHQHTEEASYCNAPEVTHGYFRIINKEGPQDKVEWEGYWIDGYYGEDYDAGGMHHELAIDIIQRCITQFIEDEQSQHQKNPTITEG